MELLLANPRGFCAGVNMAIDCVEEVLKIKGPPIYVYHEIVHNRHVVEDFKRRGVVFGNEVEEVPAGAVLVYSAHGVSPAVRGAARKRGLIEVDATCPLVTKVHLEVLRFAKQGYTILFIGHKNHDEAVGTVGEAPGAIRVVETVEDVERLEVADPEKVAYVTQTTLSLHDAQRIISALKEKFPAIKGPPREDICYATTNRQNAVKELSDEADLVLVVGSQNSSNSQRLVETAKQRGAESHLIDDQSELDPAWFEGKKSVLVTAGASAPDHLVRELIGRIQSEFGGAEVDVRTMVEEGVAFAMPRSVKSLEVVSG
jgi:4-hydroxy-3-methylbut-2-enyl diphosphate reductase